MPSSPTSPGRGPKPRLPGKNDFSALNTTTRVGFIIYSWGKRDGRVAGGAMTSGHLLGLLEGFVDGAHHVERLFRQVVGFAVDDHLEAPDGFPQRHVLAGRAGEHFGHMERLRQKALDLAGAGHTQTFLTPPL